MTLQTVTFKMMLPMMLRCDKRCELFFVADVCALRRRIYSCGLCVMYIYCFYSRYLKGNATNCNLKNMWLLLLIVLIALHLFVINNYTCFTIKFVISTIYTLLFYYSKMPMIDRRSQEWKDGKQ